MSTSLTAVVNFALLYFLMRRRIGAFGKPAMLVVMFAKLAVAGATLAADVPPRRNGCSWTGSTTSG